MDLNHLPTFKGIDFGIERRPRVIPFDRRFEDHEQDKRMAEKLLTELSGILAWVVEGCQRWRKRGLDPPEAVSLATRRYRDENNHLPAFVEDQYVKREGTQVTVQALKQDYAGWCLEQGEAALDYQRKVVPFLEQVWKLTRGHTKAGWVWLGIAQHRDVERFDAALAEMLAAK